MWIIFVMWVVLVFVMLWVLHIEKCLLKVRDELVRLRSDVTLQITPGAYTHPGVFGIVDVDEITTDMINADVIEEDFGVLRYLTKEEFEELVAQGGWPPGLAGTFERALMKGEIDQTEYEILMRFHRKMRQVGSRNEN